MAQAGISKARADQLLARYGTTARQIIAHQSEWTDADRLPDADGYSLAEIDWIARNEMIVHLPDIVMRRTTLAMSGKLTMRDLEVIAGVAALGLGWHADRIADELAATSAMLLRDHGARL
jgi:glycerol-3-phosphate dehydrogenase